MYSLDPCLDSVLHRTEPVQLPWKVQEVEDRVIGTLKVTSGQIVACDPLAMSNPTALTLTVPKGAFPITLYIAHYENGDQRIAAARVDFSSSMPGRWEIALIPGQDPSKLKPGHFFGYPVDSGTGAFMDLEAAKELDARMSREHEYFQHVCKQMDENYVHTLLGRNRI
jgi:hypothetical protein